MNSVILIGRLTRDPELVYTPGNQTAVTHFSIAVDRPTAQGKERQADFIRITTFGKQAENCDRYLHKGKQVAVNGRIQTGSYKNKDGQTVYTTDVIASNVEFLGSSQQGTPRQPDEAYSDSAPNYQDEMPDTFEATEEDIPF
uniref:Single-stranded DNA-binding protein n=1 Tax=Siphoviridae sp. ctt1f11 TaxID=2827959 RepID=A0A8S5SCS4_9CAUD|nr:MAG TPA: Single strand binding protein [Siphoviridae sp. ctt1f11]